jgi:hypothetical protein
MSVLLAPNGHAGQADDVCSWRVKRTCRASPDTSVFVQVFGCRHAETIRTLGQPASEKRQGTKSLRSSPLRGSKSRESALPAASAGVRFVGIDQMMKAGPDGNHGFLLRRAVHIFGILFGV